VTSAAFTLRRATPADAPECGRICFEAFRDIAAQHNFPPDFPAAEQGIGLLSMMTAHPRMYGVVAERDGRVIGSNFLDERSGVVGVGPITVDPAVQNGGAGRALMTAVLDRARDRGASAVRLVQSAYHNRSLSLYTKLGFDVREPLSLISGAPVAARVEGASVRPGREDDAGACNGLAVRVHGHDRAGEVVDALALGTLRVVERAGGIVGYTTGLGYFGHSVGETWRDVAALIAASPAVEGPGLLVPSRSSDLFRWCLATGRRVVMPLTLMTMGPYTEPRGAWMPSILY
jgi:predicted N-acetyltransferase YhbS